MGDKKCPAVDVCPVNRDLTKTILLRYYNCCRRGLKYKNAVLINYTQIENMVRDSLANGFQCPICKVTMAINSGQTEIESPVYSIEHIVPLSKGGENAIDNLTICCRKCNRDNNNADMMEELYE
jgi:5-methylcytosine-specific restriction endonuclease McrA